MRRFPVPQILQPRIARPIPVSGTIDMVFGVQGDATAARAASGTVAVVLGVQGDITVNPEEPVAQDLVGPFLSAALTCAHDSLTTPVGRVALYPGAQVAYDDCCDGQLWVRVISMTPSGNPANAGRNQAPCGVLMWTVTIGVGVVRCAATLDENGNAPSVAALSADTLQTTQDMADIAEGLQCCLEPLVGRLMMSRWDPLGPEGECVGGEWVATALIDNCRCP